MIVATRDSTATVAERINNLLAADYPPALLDVVVCVDSQMAPGPRAGLHGLASERVHVVDGDAGGGKAASLNAGVRAARGEIVVFTDTHQRFEPDAIKALVLELLGAPRAAVVGGALYLPGDRPGQRRSPVEWYWAAERRLREAESRLHSSIGVSGSIYAMWRSRWTPLRTGLILDDVFVPMQQVLDGYRVAYTLAARAWDTRRTDASAERVRKVRTLTGNFQLVAWLPLLLVPVRNPVWLQLVSHKLLRLATPWLLLLLLAAGVALTAVGVGHQLDRLTGLAVLVLVAALALVLAALAPLRRRAMAAASWFVSLNSALVQASVNGVRRQWDVW